MKLALKNIDWFKVRGFLLGRDETRGIFYISSPGTGRVDFGSIEQAKIFVENYSNHYLAQCRGENNE